MALNIEGAHTEVLIATDKLANRNLRVRYVGDTRLESTASARRLFDITQNSLPLLLPRLIKYEHDAFILDFPDCLRLDEHLASRDFDLGDRLTIARKLVAGLANLASSNLSIDCSQLPSLIFIEPLSYQLKVFDIAKMKPGEDTGAEQSKTLESVGHFFSTTLFSGYSGKSTEITDILGEMCNKLVSHEIPYRTLNTLAKDLNVIATAHRRGDSISAYRLDSISTSTSLVASNLETSVASLRILQDTYKNGVEDGVIAYVVTDDRIAADRLVEAFLTRITDTRQIVRLDADKGVGKTTISDLIQAFLSRYILPFDTRKKAFASLLRVRFGDSVGHLTALFGQQISESLGLPAHTEPNTLDFSLIVSSVGELVGHERRRRIVVIKNYNQLDANATIVLNHIFTSGNAKRVMLVAECATPPALSESGIRIHIPAYTSEQIQSLLTRIFSKNRFDAIDLVANRIHAASDGRSSEIIGIIEGMVQAGDFYEDESGAWKHDARIQYRSDLLSKTNVATTQNTLDGVARIKKLIATSRYPCSESLIAIVLEEDEGSVSDLMRSLVSGESGIIRKGAGYCFREPHLETLTLQSMTQAEYAQYLIRLAQHVFSARYSEQPDLYAQRIGHIALSLYRADIKDSLPFDLSKACLTAGHFYHHNNDWSKASTFLSIGIDNFSHGASSDDKCIYVASCLSLMDALFQCRDIESSQALMERHVISIDVLKRVPIVIRFVEILRQHNLYSEAFSVCVKTLSDLSLSVPDRFVSMDAVKRYLRIRKTFDNLGDEDLKNMPRSSSEQTVMASRLLAQMVIIAYMENELTKYVPWLIFRSIEIALDDGTTDEFPLLIIGYAYIKHVIPIKRAGSRDFETSYSIAKSVLEKNGNSDPFIRLFVDFVYLGILDPWKRPISSVVDELDDRIDAAKRTSQGELAGFFSAARFFLGSLWGTNVREIESKLDFALPEIERIAPGTPASIHRILYDTVKVLKEPADTHEYTVFRNTLRKRKEASRSNPSVAFAVDFSALMVMVAQRRPIDAIGHFLSGLYTYMLGAAGLPYLATFLTLGFFSYSSAGLSRQSKGRLTGIVVPRLLRWVLLPGWIFSLAVTIWTRKYGYKYQHLIDYAYAERHLFSPIRRDSALLKLERAFISAMEVGARFDALIIGYRILDVTHSLGLTYFKTTDIESRIQHLAYDLGMQSSLLSYRGNGTDGRTLSSSETLNLRLYADESLSRNFESACDEILSLTNPQRISVLGVNGFEITELYRASGRDREVMNRLVNNSEGHFHKTVVSAVQSSGSVYGLMVQSDDNQRTHLISVGLITLDGLCGALFVEHRPDDDIARSRRVLETVSQKLAICFARDRLRSALDAVRNDREQAGERISHINHEIRTPVNGLVGLSGKLEHLVNTEGCSEEVKAYARNIKDCASSLLAVHKSIEAAVKDDFVLVEEPFDLRIAILSPFVAIQEAFEDKGVRLVPPVIDALAPIAIGDRGKISQVITNLLSNALKATTRGSVEGRVRATIVDGTINLELTIRDTGCGIPEEKLSNIKRKDATAGVVGGSGLGLYLANRYAEAMDGSLTLNSKENVGTSVTVLLSLKTSSGAEAELTPLDLSSKTILCVDDEPINHLVYRARFEDTHARILNANNGWEALEVISNNPVDLIMMDFSMVGIDGVETALEIRKRYGKKHKILCVSAYDEDFIRRRHPGVEVFDGFMGKVLDPVSIARTLGAAFGIEQTTAASPTFSAETVDSSRLAADFPNTALRAQIIDRFTADFRTATARILTALDSDNPDGARSILHSLKAGAGHVHAMRLWNSVKALHDRFEELSEAQRLAAVRAIAPLLDETCEALTQLDRVRIETGYTIADLRKALESEDWGQITTVIAELRAGADPDMLSILERIDGLLRARNIEAAIRVTC